MTNIFSKQNKLLFIAILVVLITPGLIQILAHLVYTLAELFFYQSVAILLVPFLALHHFTFLYF